MILFLIYFYGTIIVTSSLMFILLWTLIQPTTLKCNICKRFSWDRYRSMDTHSFFFPHGICKKCYSYMGNEETWTERKKQLSAMGVVLDES